MASLPTEPIDGDPPDPPPTPVYPPTITTTALPNGAQGVAYAQFINVVNGVLPYAFSVSAGALPPGLALNAVTGEITGTITAAGDYTFIVSVMDGDGVSSAAALTITIPSQPSIANVSLPAGTVGIPYQASLSGQGGAQPYGFQVLSGGLPAGLTLATTGGITGTPTTAGSYTVTIQIYDSNSPQGTSSTTYTIVISAANLANIVTTMDEVVLIAAEDGAIYAIVRGQRHDENYSGDVVGFLQRWMGVPAPSAKSALLQLGGATVSAKGSGDLNVSCQDDAGNLTRLSTNKRPMTLGATEITRDFMAKAVLKAERYSQIFDNGGVADAWFEIHSSCLWVRQFFSGRRG